MVTPTRTNRVVTDEDILKYEAMVEKFIRDSVKKNWNEASTNKSQGDIPLGNSGYTINDIRQHLRTEMVIALRNYDPSRKTKESTFVYTHLFNRVGQLMKKLTRQSMGYGVWMNNLEVVLKELEEE